MAEVENLTAATAADIPQESNSDVGAAELGTSPTQEPSSNSHPHDSEYDTASDLEGGDDYDDDDDEDDDGESLSDDDDDDDDEDDDDEDEGGEESAQGTESVPEKTDETQKKVDEDRSNPQYIPKRGTFYEHDDRTAEGGEGVPTQPTDLAEVNEEVSRNPQSPTAISHASKTMKKWQPASGVDRWSHDRFDANEQAPKSKSELVNSYGYDIRNEDAPPRARRRRRYGRGPSKYSRNWEDETAYLKASNTPRKPPKPSDFPALNERSKPKKTHNVREEKENRLERRLVTAAWEKPNNSSVPAPQRSHSDERHERSERHDNQRKGNKNKSFNRNYQNVGRQPAMEFKNKQRANQSQQGGTNQHYNNSQNYRLDQQQHQHHHERNINRSQHNETNEQIRNSNRPQVQTNHVQSKQNDIYNANRELPFAQMEQQQPIQQSQNTRQMAKNVPTSNLSARLQQVQNRNDPIHVGSVQMHALANQNQLVAGQQQANMLLVQQQQQHQQQQQQQQQIAVSTAVNHQDQGRPKRYSSIRRSQHDTSNLEQQHQMQQQQQLHMQQQVATQPLMLQDQHLLQANLMQLYHQENLQAQMQAMQVSAGQQPVSQKPTAYTAVAPATQPPQPYASATGAGAAPTAYYVTAADPYTGPPALAAQATSAPQYAPQPAPNYLQNKPVPATGAPLTFTSPPPPLPQQAVGVNVAATVPAAGPIPYGGPNTVTSGAPPVQNGPPPTVGQPGYQNYTNYQNYNTVGGTTYFVPPVQATSRPTGLPQRRPTNAIPILPPSEKNKQRNQQDSKDGTLAKDSTNTTSSTQVGSVENIDHIIDNMFVQRPAFQPPVPQVQKTSPPPSEGTSVGVGDSGNTGSIPAQNSSNTSQNEETLPENQANKDSVESVGNVVSTVKEAI